MSLYSREALIAECERYRVWNEELQEELTLVRIKVDEVLETLVMLREQGTIVEEDYYELFRLVAEIKYEGGRY